jgi:MFS transporter, ACS family, hexuronate transporter
LGFLGVPVASLLGAPFLSFLIEKVDWKFMFFILGSLGVFWGLLWLIFFSNLSKSPYFVSPAIKAPPEKILKQEEHPKEKVPWKKIFSSPLFWGNCVNFFIFGYIVFFALVWLPGYIEQTFEISILKTGGLLIFPWITSAIFVLMGGWTSDVLWKKTKSMRTARVFPIGIGMLFAGICFGLISFSHTLRTHLLLFSLGYGFAFFTNSPIFGLNADLFRKHAGTAQGIMNTFFAFAGIISPALTGWVIHTTGNFRLAIHLVFALSILASFISFFIQREPKSSKI